MILATLLSNLVGSNEYFFGSFT